MQGRRSLDLHASSLRKGSGIGKADNKPTFIGSKHKTQEAISQIEAVNKAIDARKKKKGEVQDDKDFKGLANLPLLLVKLLLEYDYFYDCLKFHAVIAER